jgi:hypothetical protein
MGLNFHVNDALGLPLATRFDAPATFLVERGWPRSTGHRIRPRWAKMSFRTHDWSWLYVWRALKNNLGIALTSEYAHNCTKRHEESKATI